MENINEAIISRVNEEARAIIEEAEEKAHKEINRAQKQREAKLEEERGKLRKAAEEEAARIHARSSIKERQVISAKKSSVITRIIDMAESKLSHFTADEHLLEKLLTESLDALGGKRARIYISPRDMASVQKLLASSETLASRVEEIKELQRQGGIVAEDIDGKLRIDNTYATRLEMLLPQLLPQISKELF
jgi:vacuolar-type H+-ATPase subunit E/Vma4